MVKIENDCVGPCPMGCIGNACRYRNVPYYYCDKCGEEADKLYSDGCTSGLCEDCAREEMLSSINEWDFDELCEATGFSEVTEYE